MSPSASTQKLTDFVISFKCQKRIGKLQQVVFVFAVLYFRVKTLFCFNVSQSFSTASSIVGCWEAGAYLQQSMGERQGTPWTGRQSITGQHTNNHAHIHSYT
ncbi:hypothetical protein AMECASPLE_016110 [Ameca splendens]|uniref:Uncharacterized protein n=1 Tax=Ameca splendens TaxID=208324 RepID=A0ABV0YPX0_9TELE